MSTTPSPRPGEQPQVSRKRRCNAQTDTPGGDSEGAQRGGGEGAQGILRRGDHPRSLHRTRSVLGRALRLMLHVRCTCTAESGHVEHCHRLQSLRVLADAERLGVDVTYDCPEGSALDGRRERMARALLNRR